MIVFKQDNIEGAGGGNKGQYGIHIHIHIESHYGKKEISFSLQNSNLFTHNAIQQLSDTTFARTNVFVRTNLFARHRSHLLLLPAATAPSSQWAI